MLTLKQLEAIADRQTARLSHAQREGRDQIEAEATLRLLIDAVERRLDRCRGLSGLQLDVDRCIAALEVARQEVIALHAPSNLSPSEITWRILSLKQIICRGIDWLRTCEEVQRPPQLVDISPRADGR